MKQWKITFIDQSGWTIKNELRELDLNEKGALVVFTDDLKKLVGKVEEFGIREIQFLGEKSIDTDPVIRDIVPQILVEGE